MDSSKVRYTNNQNIDLKRIQTKPGGKVTDKLSAINIIKSPFSRQQAPSFRHSFLQHKSFKLVRLTCEGNLHDPNFPGKLKNLITRLKILLLNGKNFIKVTKVEPWNSVRVTLNLSDDAAQHLRQLAEHGDENLREIGILSVQLDGQQVISLILPEQTNVGIENNNSNVISMRNNQNGNNNNDNVFTIEDPIDRKIGNVDFINSNNNNNNNMKIKEIEPRTTPNLKNELFDNKIINGSAISSIDESSNSSSINSGASNHEQPSGVSSSTLVAMTVDNNTNNVPEKQQTKLNPYSSQKSASIEPIKNSATTTISTSLLSPSSLTSMDSSSVEDSNNSQSTIQLHHHSQQQAKINFINTSTTTSDNKSQNTSDCVQKSSVVKQEECDHNASPVDPTIRVPTKPRISNVTFSDAIQTTTTTTPTTNKFLQAHASNQVASNSLNNNNNIQISNSFGTSKTVQQQRSNVISQSQTSTNITQSSPTSKLVPIVVVPNVKPSDNLLSSLSSSNTHAPNRHVQNSNPTDTMTNNESLPIYQRKTSNSSTSSSSSSYHQPSIKNEPLLNKMTNSQQESEQIHVLLPNQQISVNNNHNSTTTNQTQSSDILLGSNIDAVDDDLLASVAATGVTVDPNDFTDLNDLNLLSMLEEMETNTTNNQNQSITSNTTTNHTSTTSLSDSRTIPNEPIVSTQVANTDHSLSVPQNKTDSENRASKSLSFFLTQKPQPPLMSPSPTTQLAPTAKISTNNQQSILINSPNSTSVLSAAQQAQSAINSSNNTQSTASGTSTPTPIFSQFGPMQNATIFSTKPSLKQQQQQASAAQQQSIQTSPSSSSPRQIYVPARTQQSWRTMATVTSVPQQQQSQSPILQTSSISSPNKSRSQATVGNNTSTSGGDITLQQSPQQQTRFVTVNNGSNNASSLIRQSTNSPQLNSPQIIHHKVPQQKQIVIRSGSFSSSSTNQQKQPCSSSSDTTTPQNPVALSSPLLVNLLQSDVPCSPNNNSSSPTIQQPQTIPPHHHQQQQFITSNSSTSDTPQQIRLTIPHTAEGGSPPVMTQLMIRVSSAGHHQVGQNTTTTHQFINPIAANVVASVPSTQQQQQQQIVTTLSNQATSQSSTNQQTSNNNNNDNNNTNNNKKKKKKNNDNKNDITSSIVKPKKTRKSRKKVNQTAELTMSESTSSVQATPTTQTQISSQFSGTINSIPICSTNTDMSARMQTSSVSTFLTIPTNSAAQSLKLQQSTSSNQVHQQTLLSNQQSGGHHHHIQFQQKQRVQPVVMIAANSAHQIDGSNSITTASANSAMVSSSGGTFIIANVPANSLNASNTVNSPIITSSATISSAGGVQLSGNRKQIFLATKSNSFPVSSALSAGAIVARFANTNPAAASSTQTLVSTSPVKLVSQPQIGQQPTSQNVGNNAPTQLVTAISPNHNELRNISNVGAVQQPSGILSVGTSTNKPSPSHPMLTSPMIQQTSQISINPSNLIQSSANSGNNINLFTTNTNPTSTNSNSTTILQNVTTTAAVAVPITNIVSSPIRATKSYQQEQQQQQQLLLTPVESPSSSSLTTTGNQQPQQTNSTSFKTTFQVTKNNPSNLLLNKLNQQPNPVTAATMLAKISLPCSTTGSPVTKIPFHKTPTHTSNIVVQKQMMSVVQSSEEQPNVIENTFVVKNSETTQVPNLVHCENKSSFITSAVPTPLASPIIQAPHSTERNEMVTKNVVQDINFKQSLVEMLGRNVENTSPDKLDSVFLDDDPTGRISEPTAPISPSYFLAPATSFDAKCENQMTLPSENINKIDSGNISEQQDNSSSLEQKKNENQSMTNISGEANNDSNDTTSNVTSTLSTCVTKAMTLVTSVTNTMTTISSTATLTNSEFNNSSNPFTKSLLSNVSTMKTDDTQSKKNTNPYDSFYVLKRNYSQDLPDHILDDDEEDGDDSDPDDFGFYSSRPSHFLSGSIGSISGNSLSTTSSLTTSKTSESLSLSLNVNNSEKEQIESNFLNLNQTSQKEKPSSKVEYKVSTILHEDFSKNVDQSSMEQDAIEKLKIESIVDRQSQQVDDKNLSNQSNLTNGDISQSSSSLDEGKNIAVTAPSTIVIETPSTDEKPILAKLSPSVASKSYPITTTRITTITNKVDNTDSYSIKATIKSEDAQIATNELIKSPEVSKLLKQEESEIPPPSPPPTIAKNRPISLPELSPSSSLKLFANKSATTKTSSSSDTSLNVSSLSSSSTITNKQSLLVSPSTTESSIVSNSNPEIFSTIIQNNETNKEPSINNNNNNKKPVLIHLKHPPPHSIAASTIQISNPNPTLSHFLQTTENATSTSLTTSTSTTGSPNQKFRVVVPYRIPSTTGQSSHGGQSFQQIGQLQFVVKPSSSASTQFKLISNKLPVSSVAGATSQGSSQPIFIPVLSTSNNQGAVFSVKPNSATTQVVASNDLPPCVVSNIIKPLNIEPHQQQPTTMAENTNESKFTIARKTTNTVTNIVESSQASTTEIPVPSQLTKTRKCLPTTNVDVGMIQNISDSNKEEITEKLVENTIKIDKSSVGGNNTDASEMTQTNKVITSQNITSFDLTSHSIVETVVNLSDTITTSSPNEFSPETSTDNENVEESPSSNIDSSIIDDITTGDKNELVIPNVASQTESNQIDQPNTSVVVKSKESQLVANKPTLQSRTVHIVLPTNNDSTNVTASNVVILKTESPRASKDNKDSSSNSRSNSPNASVLRPIFITAQKPVVAYNQTTLNQSQDASSLQTPPAIFATKSNNSITATKTLPSILRQSKRKIDNIVFQAQSVPSITIDPLESIKTSSMNIDTTPIAAVNDCNATLFGESDNSEQSTTTSSNVSTLSFKPQKYQSLLSTNEDDSISDISSDSSRPRKRARKSKVTTIQQHVAAATGNITGPPLYVNFVNTSFDQQEQQTSTSEKSDQNELSKRSVTETPTINSRILRNSTTTILPLSKPIQKRGQRNNQRALFSPSQQSTATETSSIPVMQNESITVFTTNEPVIKSNEKTKRARETNLTISSGSNRQTRSNRSRKKVPELSSANTTMINAEAAETMVPCDTTIDSQQQSSLINQATNSNLITKNLNLSSIISSESSSTPVVTSSFVSAPQSINVISVSNTGEHLVSLLESSDTNAITTSANNNNSLLVKRSRKSLPTVSTLRPSLRNTSVTGTISPPTMTPAKRRRLTKDVTK